MWRPALTLLKTVVNQSITDNISLSRLFYSSKSRAPRSAARVTVVSASIGLLAGAGYGGYTHYKINMKTNRSEHVTEEYPLLKNPPQYTSQFKVINESDNSNLHLILFQYRTCPFCCKVRAYFDFRGLSYEVVEVDAVLRQSVKWSTYKKVPIVLAKVDGGYQQLMDSSAIISALETYLQDTATSLKEIVKFYPANRFDSGEGKPVFEIANKYFVMHNYQLVNEQVNQSENAYHYSEERKWRKWADNVLVHTLSPNVYRTPNEALETFKWFEEVGGWRQSFPWWECALMVYGGATAMWLISKRLKSRHHIDDARQALYDAANVWISALKKKGTRFLGGDKPNLADISVYGVLSSIEGCRAFQDVRNHTDIGKWYDDIKNTLEKSRGKVSAVAM